MKNMKKSIVFCLMLYPFLSFSLISEKRTSSSPSESRYSQFFREGGIHKKNGDFDQAVQAYEAALSQARTLKNPEKQCQTLLELGLVFWNLGNLSESTRLLESALHIAQTHSLSACREKSKTYLEIYRLYTLGKDYRNKDQYQESIQSFQKAIALAQETQSPEHTLKCLRQIGVTYWLQYNLKDFFQSNKTALSLAKKLNHKREIGKISNNLGIYYDEIGNYAMALQHYEDASLWAKETKNKTEESYCLNNMGIIYDELGEYEKAIVYLEKALAIDSQLGDNLNTAKSLSNLGNIYRQMGIATGNREHLFHAIEYFIQSLETARALEDKKAEAYVFNNLGAVHSDLEQYDQALEYFKQGYEKAKENRDQEAKGMILNNMGIVHLNQGNYGESTRLFQEAIDLAQRIEGGKILWEAYLELARAYTKKNEYENALESFKRSIAIIENIRSEINLEELRASFLGSDKRLEAYQGLIHLLVFLHQNQGNPSYDREAFQYVERAKARAFLDRLEVSQVNIQQHVDFRLVNQEKELIKDISSLLTKLYTLDVSETENSHLHKTLAEKEHALETLKREIRTKSPVYASLKYPKIITLEQAQNLLDSQTGFLEYCIGKDKSHGFFITKKSLKIFSIPPRKSIQSLVSDYLKVITDKDTQNFDLGYDLFKTLVPPGLDKRIKNIIIVPDDILNFLPFETLITDKSQPKWLVQDYRVSYSPSISCLRELIARKKQNSSKRAMDLVAFGDPYFGPHEDQNTPQGSPASHEVSPFYRLKYSGVEIERISTHFKASKVKTFQRNLASEEQIKQHPLKDYKIIHFATHCQIDNKNPSRSFIVLSLDQNKPEDGFLQAREIYNLELNADLVALSACQTGLGKFIRGEGIEGINRAFFFAGASSAVISLWPVNDQATSQLMERFYGHLRSSEKIASSLRKTKLEMIASDILSHPYYWAGFTISGKANHVIFPRPKIWPFVALSVLVICGLIGVKSRKKHLLNRR